MDQLEMLRKKAIFQGARRAMLENEAFLREYVTNCLPESYGLDELERLNVMLEKIFDNDLFDVIMGNKKTEDFEGMYDQQLLKDIEIYAAKQRELVKQGKGKLDM
ncbi:MAG: succinate dehydrogenase assembly factor 2 [Deferribacterales bacterium]|jgi:antitoxin CptB